MCSWDILLLILKSLEWDGDKRQITQVNKGCHCQRVMSSVPSHHRLSVSLSNLCINMSHLQLITAPVVPVSVSLLG